MDCIQWINPEHLLLALGIFIGMTVIGCAVLGLVCYKIGFTRGQNSVLRAQQEHPRAPDEVRPSRYIDRVGKWHDDQ